MPHIEFENLFVLIICFASYDREFWVCRVKTLYLALSADTSFWPDNDTRSVVLVCQVKTSYKLSSADQYVKWLNLILNSFSANTDNRTCLLYTSDAADE